ncbi:hypothetical protein BH11BAC5_BH11BAC5_18030 [soil metagenome]
MKNTLKNLGMSWTMTDSAACRLLAAQVAFQSTVIGPCDIFISFSNKQNGHN